MLRSLLLAAADSQRLEALVTGRPALRNRAMRFIAGETLDDGIAVTRELASRGRLITLDFVGEDVTAAAEARKAADVYLDAVARIQAESLPAGISVKPTQLGVTIARELCEQLLGEIAQAAGDAGQHVTLDMEGHEVTERTVSLVEAMQARGHSHVGCAVQAYLHRTHEDVRRLSAVGASVRLCKGAYDEPEFLAYQDDAEISASYLRAAEHLLVHGTLPRLATHDHRLVAAVKEQAARLRLDRDAYEFQMLLGVRPEMQDALVDDGHRLCVYVPFGRQWYAYFVRRLAERPANLVFFLRALARR